MGLFKIDPGLAIWTWIVFGVLLYLLSKFVFPSLLKSLRQREENIARSVDNAARIDQRLAEIETEHSERIRQANAEADEILRKIRAEGEELRKKLAEKAEAEARDIYEQAKIRIADEKAAALESMRQEIADFVVDTSEKIIGRSLGERDDQEWMKELAETL